MRAVLVLVAWCLIAAGGPWTRRHDERQDPQATRIAAPMVVAKQVPRRLDAPDQRTSVVAVVTPPIAMIDPPRFLFATPHGVAARTFVALVVARSPRGPPVG